jgi:hypothetical protein
MKIVEKKVDGGAKALFELDEFLSRRLFAHLSTASEKGPRESPVWFHWDGAALWIIGGETFPQNLEREPRCAIGIVDFDPDSGMLHHVGMRGTAAVEPYNAEIGRRIFVKYCGPMENWDPRFDDIRRGDCTYPMIRFTPETVVMRDQSYKIGPQGRS